MVAASSGDACSCAIAKLFDGVAIILCTYNICVCFVATCSTSLALSLRYSERTQFVSEPALLLPAIAARTEYGAFCAVEARIASLTDVIRRPLGGIFGEYPLIRKKQ